MASPVRSRRAMVALMATAAALFSIMNFVAHRVGAGAGAAHWAWIACSRAIVGTVVAVTVAMVRKRPAFVAPSRIMWVRSIFGTIAMAATFFAVSRRELPLGDTTTLLNLTPILLALLAPLVLGERSGGNVWGPLALSASGVLLIVRPSFLFGGTHALPVEAALPAIVAIGASLFSAFAMMSLRRASGRDGPEAIVVHFSLFGAVTLAMLAIAVRAPVPPLSVVPWLVGAGLCGGLAQLAMTRAYSLGAAARVSGIGYLAVPFSALLAAVAMGEMPARWTIVGMGLVVVGGVLLSLSRGAGEVVSAR